MDLANCLPNIASYWPLTSGVTIILGSSWRWSCLSDLLVLSHSSTWNFPVVFSGVTLLPQAAHVGHAHFPFLCRTQHGGSTNLAVLPTDVGFFVVVVVGLSRPLLAVFIKLHWPGTKQTLSIQHQPLVSALTAHNCLWDQALIERVIRHDFLVIAFNDLILSSSRRRM